MAAPTDYYVDPSVASNGGDGTVGTPWTRADGQCVQHALNTITRDATNGDRINIKAGTADTVPTSGYTLATYGTPTSTTMLWLTGYTSAQGDDGRGGVDVNGQVAFASTAYDYIGMYNLDFTDSGDSTANAWALRLDNDIIIFNNTFTGIDTTNQALMVDANSKIINNTITDCGGGGIRYGSNTMVVNNRIITGPTNDMNIAGIYCSSGNGNGAVIGNIVSVTGGAEGINHGENDLVENNSVYSNGGTGVGISPTSTAAPRNFVRNNLIEGFSGVGGVGLRSPSTGSGTSVYADGNAVYDCATAYDLTATRTFMGETDNETLSASPFTDAANGDFTPVDTGNVKEGALPGVIGQF